MTPEFSRADDTRTRTASGPDEVPADTEPTRTEQPRVPALLTHMYSCALPGRGSSCDCGAQ